MDIKQDSIKVSMFKSMSVHRVVLNVKLSEEEKAAIKTLGLEKELIFSWPRLGNPKDIQLLGDTCVMVAGHLGGAHSNLSFENLINAKIGMEKIEDGLRHLKSLLAAADLPDSKSMEI
jgi:hypothetical protein